MLDQNLMSLYEFCLLEHNQGKSTFDSKLFIYGTYLQFSSIAIGVSANLSIQAQCNEIFSVEKNQELFPLTR